VARKKSSRDELEHHIAKADAVTGLVQDETADTSFPIVGIGASAGGLAAFEAFFSGMPVDADPGMAFVLVQHLAPDHKSILTDIIRRYTRMAVCEVEDGMVVKPNCTYIIPPNRDMAFLGGSLQLLEPSAPRGQRMPIDYFFSSLAQDLRERAIAVVLSGTGTDGTLGIRAVKSEGGLVLAQNPASAEYDGMPHSAIATGLVDYELPPAEMPAHLISYVCHAFRNPLQTVDGRIFETVTSLRKIFVLLRSQTGHDFSQYKPSTIERRIRRRMAVQKIETAEEYLKYAQQTPEEVEALFRDLLIGVTGFFRDPEAFQVLDEKVIHTLVADASADGPIRIWVPSCSTGEEAYSIAMLLQECQNELKRSLAVQLFATDIDSRAIAIARAGVYPASIATTIAPERLARFFTAEPGGNSYRINKNIRDLVVFSVQDVIRDPPFSRIDLISCRNLLIYMSPELQKRLIPLFHYSLKPGGFLFLGTSESLGEHDALYTIKDRKQKLYQRKEDSYDVQRMSPRKMLPPVYDMGIEQKPAAGFMPRASSLPLRELTERALLQEAAPAAALVDGKGDILYLHGRTGLYLEPQPGVSGVSNILKMSREGLQRDLAMTLRKAVTSQKTAYGPRLRVKTNGEYTVVNLTVRPVLGEPADTTGERLYLVILEQAQPQASTEQTATDAAPEAATNQIADESAEQLIASLRQELRTKEEYLQTLNEELETSNEDLKSSNEEMQSINEELQSTNEELETSKEELQSVNEELSTINTELQNKVSDLTQVNNDMNNLLAGTGIGTIFVDCDLRVVRFTPAATRIINLIQSDTGRPLAHIVYNLKDYNSLLADTRTVLDTLVPREVEVQTNDGDWHLMRILPYRTLENVIEGAVLTFVDINETKKAQSSLLAAQNQLAASEAQLKMAEAIVATVREPLLILDTKLRVVLANRSFYITFQVTPEDTIKKAIDELGNHQLAVPALRTLLEQILPQDTIITDYELTDNFGQLGRRTLRLNARRMFSADGNAELILLAIEDVSG